MAREKGQSTFVKVKLSDLVERLQSTPNIKIAVSKGNLKELSAALDVDFSDVLDNADTSNASASQAASAAAEDGGDGDALSGMSVS